MAAWMWQERRKDFIKNVVLTGVIPTCCSALLSTEVAAKAKAAAAAAAQPKPSSTSSTPTRGGSGSNAGKKRTPTVSEAGSVSAYTSAPPKNTLAQDLTGLRLEGSEGSDGTVSRDDRPVPEMTMKRAELVEKLRAEAVAQTRKGVSLVVIGHVDAGKSTLMGRLLYELGELSEKEKTANERGSKRVGKGSFAFAWGLDALGAERDRGVTIDIATTHFETPHRSFTLLDAPGHQDFIPNMISGAAQADLALLTVDASIGEFESGFERGGQTREHALLVRSLGVKELIVGVNKMDAVGWAQYRFEEIQDSMKPFLQAAGFPAAKTTFIPLAAMEGINLVERDCPELQEWYEGPTLVEVLDQVEVPERPLEAPLRFPVSNVFKGQTAVASGVGVSGRLCSGVIQVGERLRIVPGDETAVVRTIEQDEESVQYASAGQNVTLYLAAVDPIHLNIGCVLCPTNDPIPLVTSFTAQILTFDLTSPIIAGTPIELFHHSTNVPATVSKLVAILDKGTVVRQNPRMLQKGVHAQVEITLRAAPQSMRSSSIPLEPASRNREMGRVLLRRGGETIGAGIVLETRA